VIAYIDSSALVKRALDEPHALELDARLEELLAMDCEFLTSTLGWVEVSRAIRKRPRGQSQKTEGDLESDALAGVSGFPISHDVVAVARRIGSSTLRSLEAIHCATATIADADLFITYDRRLLAAAREVGFVVESPGMADA
jgi:predicted nucleic acid-binding protein